ncbi:hypothetical protein [Mycobacterium sp. 1465703.0]|uniref:hypothetical protein n=1 Tax=Mycobacterium sp. 1465703.0 TaxID=1834078 RepID=UPI0007FF0902|nr:hypothetical protein [Mycobacterium sp. 1465703.0]OBJ05244.1 hypothetical protein A5625_19800 [Mycobacterium sp. 1465703.0]
MKRIAALAVSVLALLLQAAWWAGAASASTGDPGQAPCEYPFRGVSVVVDPVLGQATGGYCEGPPEENGSHHRCAWGDYTIGGSVGGQHATVGVAVGGGGGQCDYFCPDGQVADWPNPPGAWKDHLVPKPCRPKGADAPPTAPDDAPANAPPGPAGITPAVTNPDAPNPDAIANEPR